MASSEDMPEAQMTPAAAVGYASDGGYQAMHYLHLSRKLLVTL